MWRGQQNYCLRDIKETQWETIPIKRINCDETVGLSLPVLENLQQEKDNTRALLKTHLFALKGCSDPFLARKLLCTLIFMAKQILYAFQELPVTNQSFRAHPVSCSLRRGPREERTRAAGPLACSDAFLRLPAAGPGLGPGPALPAARPPTALAAPCHPLAGALWVGPRGGGDAAGVLGG